MVGEHRFLDDPPEVDICDTCDDAQRQVRCEYHPDAKGCYYCHIQESHVTKV